MHVRWYVQLRHRVPDPSFWHSPTFENRSYNNSKGSRNIGAHLMSVLPLLFESSSVVADQGQSEDL